LFGCARDVAALGAMYWRGGKSLLKGETVAEMTHLQAQDGAASASRSGRPILKQRATL
jgi:hypothetical protein